MLKYIYILLTILVLSCKNDTKHTYNKSIEEKQDIQINEEEKLFFGFEKRNFVIEQGKIKRNQNLGNILISYGVNYGIIDSLAKFDTIFDIRKIRTGNNYFVLKTKDSLHKPKYFIYEINKVDYVSFGICDSVFVKKSSKKIIRKKTKLQAVITTSLWNAIADKSKDPVIANDLSDIYAWTIDFFGLQKGDSFTVVYTEKYVDSVYVGIDTIFASSFIHNSQIFYAFLFYQDGRYSYFDEKGNSLRKAFLKAPLKYSRISSRFSNSRLHPVLKIRRPHHGVDYAAPIGTPVYSIGDGKIIKKAWDRGGGNFIKIKHNSVYTTVYMHLSSFAKGIKTGDYVKQGQLIAYVGKTGLATGPHLDFRVYKNGHPIDPLKMEAPSVEPVKKENRGDFEAIKRKFIKELLNK